MDRLSTFAAAAVLVFATTSSATEVYRWTDADGIVHFSDTRPENDSAETLVVRETTPEDYDPAADPYSIVNQAERLAENRERLAKEREEREEIRRERVERIIIYEREPDYRYRAYFGPWYPPVLPPVHRPASQLRVAGRQARALEETGLNTARPASINSGVHQQRVAQSQALPLAGGPPPRVTPR